jgi:hypothetical protein
MSELDYLDEFDNLEYKIRKNEDRIVLTNLKELGGMEVAELLTYLHDDHYLYYPAMSSSEDNGSLIVEISSDLTAV